MKTKKLLALVLTICLAFSCIAVVPFTASADETPTATATTNAVWIGKSKLTAKTPSMVVIPLTYDQLEGAGDGTLATLTFDYKSSDGTRPVVGMCRATTPISNGEFLKSYSNGSWTPSLQLKYSWANNGTSSMTNPKSGKTALPGVTESNGHVSLTVSFADIPGVANCFYGQSKNGNKITRVDATGNDSDAIWAAITIGNGAFEDTTFNEYHQNAEYLISNPSLKINGKTTEMVPDFSSYNDTAVYSIVGNNSNGTNTNARNHPLCAPKGKWSKFTTDPETVKFVTVDDDFVTSNRTYIKHDETVNTREYYTCGDFGDNVKFEKLGTSDLYAKIDNDVNKKSVVIGSDGTDKVTNIYVPLYTHSVYSGLDDSNKIVREDGGYVRLKVEFNAKRLSGSGQPVIGSMYSNKWDAYGNACGSDGYAYSGTDTKSKGKTWVNSTYNESTGKFTAYVASESGTYDQTTEYNGANAYITIGNCEHMYGGGFDAKNFGASFIISDIKVSVCGLNESETVLAENIAPEMVAGNYCFGPSTSAPDDLSAWHIYTKNTSNTTNGTYKTGFCYTPLNKWYADGAYQQVKTINRNACNAAAHTLVHHTATANTREYWSCATCAKNYVDKYASAECDTIYATPKMIAVKASGSRPGNAFITIDNPGASGEHFYKFTCDMRIFGDDVPTISAVQGSYWGGNNAQAVTSWTNNSDQADDEGLYASYDPNTRKYEAIFKVDHPNHEYPSKYYNAVSGAYAALLLGNSRLVGAGGRTDTKYYSSFIFGNPQIVEVDKENNFAEIGENICPAISDKTLNFGTSYSGQTQQVYNNENTMHQTNNILAAPVGKWNVDGDRSWVVSMDIPDETFFTQDQGFAPKMLRTSGSGAKYNAISTEAFLKPGETYQFDIDYREFGSPARIFLQVATTSANSYSTLVGTPTADNVDGAHKSIIFTMPSDARSDGGGNFRVYLGQSAPNGTNKNTTTVNFANAQLRWYDTEEEEVAGANIFLNGAFDFGEVGNITQQNKGVTLFGWNAESITTFAKHDLITIPEGFFDGDIGENNYAMKINAKGGVYLRTAVELLPNSVYELSYNYRATDDDINIGIKTQGDTDLTYTTSLVSNHTADKFKKTYTITTGGTTDGYQSNNTQANTVIEFRCPANADGNILYISNLQLHKVENNAFVGMNMLGDRNAIYDPATYYPANENNFTFASDNNWKAQSMIDDLGHAWWGSTTSTSDANRSTITGSIVKVNDNFFTYLAPATRLAKLTEVLLGKADASNPYLDKTCLYYNPDGKGTTNILDLVKVKKDIVNIGDEGGAGAEAAAMLSTINNAANTNTGSKTTYKVSKSQTTSQLISTLSNAANNSVVLLERGGVWRVPAGAENGFTLKNGVSLGAYGTGAKPMLIGSAYNYASRTWTQVATNIWKTAITSYQSGNRPGNVYFYDNGTYKTTPLIGRIIKDGARFTSYSQLEKEGDVYYDITNAHFTGDKNVYVYSTSDPANKYTDIEIGEKHDVLALVGYNTVDNICIKYAGGHGINATSRNSITIKNCEIAYVGGTPNGSDETMGNGIQFGLGGSNLTVDSCYVHDCYDAGITFQSWSGQYTFDGVNFTNNLLVDNFYNIEFFTTGTSANKEGSNGSDGTMKNINISGNIMRFAGGWSFNQRQGNQLRCANICVTQGAYYVNTQNLKITGNIFDCTMVQHVMWTWGFGTHTSDTNHPGLTISGNTYYQKAGSLDGRVNRFGCVSGTGFDYAGSTDTLKTAIAKMDTRPTKIAWVNRTDKF